MPRVFWLFSWGIGFHCVYATTGRMNLTFPPRPASSEETKKLLPLCGRMGLSMVLKPKDGLTELVTIPCNASGPEILRKLSVWNRLREASLKVVMLVLSKE